MLYFCKYFLHPLLDFVFLGDKQLSMFGVLWELFFTPYFGKQLSLFFLTFYIEIACFVNKIVKIIFGNKNIISFVFANILQATRHFQGKSKVELIISIHHNEWSVRHSEFISRQNKLTSQGPRAQATFATTNVWITMSEECIETWRFIVKKIIYWIVRIAFSLKSVVITIWTSSNF